MKILKTNTLKESDNEAPTLENFREIVRNLGRGASIGENNIFFGRKTMLKKLVSIFEDRYPGYTVNVDIDYIHGEYQTVIRGIKTK